MPNPPVSQLTNEELDLIEPILKKLDGSKPFGSARLFDLIAAVSRSVTWQPVWLREKDGQIQVWLRDRGPNEAYPGSRSCPSGTLLPKETFATGAQRIAEKFYGGPFSHKEFVTVVEVPDEVRGTFDHHVYLVEVHGRVDGLPAGTAGWWYDVDYLPENVVDHHKKIVALAVPVFKKRRRQLIDAATA